LAPPESNRERLDLRLRLDLNAYLKLHDEVDILLDTLPFSSGTTANFALWMGVPTLTLAGNSLIQRLGASRMAAARLEAFIAETEDDYVDRAVDWSRRPADLGRIRAGLREQVPGQRDSASDRTCARAGNALARNVAALVRRSGSGTIAVILLMYSNFLPSADHVRRLEDIAGRGASPSAAARAMHWHTRDRPRSCLGIVICAS
jgi:hypothetical protein